MEELHVMVLVMFRCQVLRDIMLALLYCAACRMAEVAEMQWSSSCSTSPGVLTRACNDGLDDIWVTLRLNTLDIYSNLFGRSVTLLLWKIACVR